MHQHDPDLIMALAEGTLGDADAIAAEAEITACPQCTADLVSQRSAVEMLTGAPRVYLSAAESGRLRAAVRRELRLGTAKPRLSRRPRFSLGALAGAAAVLLVIVIAVPTLNLLGRGGGDAAVPSFDDALAPPTLAPAGESAAPETAAAAPLAPPSVAPSAGAPQAARNAAPDLGLSAPAPEPLPDSGLPLLKIDADLEELRSLLIAGDGRLPAGALAEAELLTTEDIIAYAASPQESSGLAADAPGEAATVQLPLSCDLDAIPEILVGAYLGVAGTTARAVALIDHEGIPALVVAVFGETIEDTRIVIEIVVLSIATCEVLDST